MLSKFANCTRLLSKSLVLVGYEMIIANSALRASLALPSHIQRALVE